MAILASTLIDRGSLRFMEGTWVFHTFIWTGTVWILATGNHMATGSWILRGLRDWP